MLGVVSQHRFDRASLFLSSAIRAGRLGKLLQCDAYVKWWRSDEYYARPVKGSWATEGGGALINQAIHQVDLLLWFAGPVRELFGMWQLGAAHTIESEDVVNAVTALRERRDRRDSGRDGALAGLQRARRDSRHEGQRHHHRRSVDDVGREGRCGRSAAAQTGVASGASDPMAISVESFERQFLDFGEAIRDRAQAAGVGRGRVRGARLVDAIYSCRCRDASPLSPLI